MITIGLRVYSNSKIFYCLLEQDNNGSLNYLDISHLNIPLSLQWPEALNFARNTILDILIQYKVDKAIIRICEFGTTMNEAMIERSYIEGVLQETIASSSVKKYLAGKIASFASLLRIERDAFKKFANAELVYPNIPPGLDWNSLKLEERETILTASAALNL
jgi:hypothetical protein